MKTSGNPDVRRPEPTKQTGNVFKNTENAYNDVTRKLYRLMHEPGVNSLGFRGNPKDTDKTWPDWHKQPPARRGF